MSVPGLVSQRARKDTGYHGAKQEPPEDFSQAVKLLPARQNYPQILWITLWTTIVTAA